MKKPVFPYSGTVFAISALLTVPLLIEICTACNLFSLWIAWMLFALICVVSAIRLVHGFRQKCYKFCWGLIAQLVAGGVILTFFQLSYNNIIQTPVSHPLSPAVVDIKPPEVLVKDSLTVHHEKSDSLLKHRPDSVRIKAKKL